MTTERPNPEPVPGIRYYDADYAPPGATNIMNHGWGVVDADGEQIGKVDQVYDNEFTIAEGFIIHDIVYAPFAAVDRVDIDDEKVYLNVTQAQIETMDWEAPSYATGFGTADNFVAGHDGSSHEGGIVRPVGSMVTGETAAAPAARAGATPARAMAAPAETQVPAATAAAIPTTPERPETTETASSGTVEAIVVEEVVVVETPVTDEPTDSRQR